MKKDAKQNVDHDHDHDDDDDGRSREIAARPDLAGFVSVAQGVGVGIIGTLLKFTKGEYFASDGGVVEEVPLGTRFLVDITSLTRGWCYWRDGKVITPLINRIAENVPMPQRAELSEYQEEDKWPPGPDGRPKDPWSPDSRGLFYSLEIPSGEEFTFASPSWGGIHAFQHLCKAYVAGCAEHPDPHEWPIVELAATKRASKKYGSIKEPLFPIVAWATLSDVVAGNVDDEDAAEDPEPKRHAPSKSARAALDREKTKVAKK